MSQTKLHYDDLKQEIIKELQKHEFGYLATSEKDHVTNRMIRIIADGLTIWSFTGQENRKYKQIMANPNIAFAVGNLQIEGVAALKGHVLDEANATYHSVYREKYPESYEHNYATYFQLPEIRLMEFSPRRLVLFKTKGPISETYYDILDTVKKEAHRVMVTDIKTAPSYTE